MAAAQVGVDKQVKQQQECTGPPVGRGGLDGPQVIDKALGRGLGREVIGQVGKQGAGEHQSGEPEGVVGAGSAGQSWPRILVESDHGKPWGQVAGSHVA